MQSTRLDVNKQIQITFRTGKVALGAKEALESAKFAKAKLTLSDAPSTIIGLKVVGCTRPFSMKTREKQISIHIAHITESFN